MRDFDAWNVSVNILPNHIFFPQMISFFISITVILKVLSMS